MTSTRVTWARSLYGRIVLTFGACLAGVLVAQVIAVQWWLQRAPDAQELRALTQTVAADLGRVLEQDPHADLQHYVDEHYPDPVATIYVVIAADQQVILRGSVLPPEDSIKGAIEYYRDNPHPARLPESWINGTYQVTEITVHGAVAGGVGAVTRTSWRELIGWKMAALSVALLVLATGVAGLFVFGPVRRRLADLERAARLYGTGDFDARVDIRGVDELARLAETFNRMALDLGRRDEMLKASDRTRRLLLADVSHELMTPLTAVRAYHEVLSMHDIARDPEAAQCLAVIADETQRLERLIGDLLDLARLEAGGDSLEQQDVSVENLIGRVAARHEIEARQKGVRVTTSIGEGAELLVGDPLRLEQALQNLASNALRHTPPGGEIEVRATLADGNVVLTVRDTGRGIPVEHLPFVFDRFYKVDPARASTPATGSGLGLSIVKAIVERHGGSVSATSEPGVSTTFAIRLPVAEAA